MAKSRQLKVTHIRTSHGLAGAERVILCLIQTTQSKCVKKSVTLIGSDTGLNKDFLLELKSLNIETANFRLQGRYDIRGIRRLRRHLIDNEIDIIHCHDFKSNFYGLMASIGLPIGRVSTHHGSTKDDLLLRCYLNLNEYLFFHFFHRIVAVSHQLSTEPWARILGSDRVAFIPNGIDTQFFKRSPNTFTDESPILIPGGKTVIGIIGRLYPDKGHIDLFHAISGLQDEFPQLMVLVVGDGPQSHYLKNACREMRIENRVIFAGVRKNMQAVYSLLDLFVMPSIREGLPMALLEAMLAKIPVIASMVGGIPTLLENNRHGIGISPKSPKELSAAIRQTLVNPDEAKLIANNAQEFIREKYSAQAMTRRTERLYIDILKKLRRNKSGHIENIDSWSC
ncbi:MAG: glycosyltransferase family 4 protein [Desulfobacteraceae bacterium]|nr:glycosyltransferase family 4 protein [Desulfobacteraceae bacterium]MBC2749208.1 glycosyltransferase family 4 protein [Desulfobacteraceae bacterium]